MKEILKLCFLCFILGGSFISCSRSEINIRIDNERIVIQNRYMERIIGIRDGISTTNLINRLNNKEYSSTSCREFEMTINGKAYTGKDFKYVKANVFDISGGKQLDVRTIGAKPEIEGIELLLSFMVYEDMPVVRKQISLKNDTANELELVNLNMESLAFLPGHTVYSNYGTLETGTPFIGDHSDPAVLLYDGDNHEGIILGNETPSMLKRIGCYEEPGHVSIGMKRIDEDYSFKAYVKKGEEFISPRSFILLTAQKSWEDCFDIDLARFIRNHLGVKIFNRQSCPLFYYCTWIPFENRITESLIREIADNLEGTGVDVLIIDDGWQDLYGDMNSHAEKFPNGVEKSCEYIRSKGLKAGLWYPLALAGKDSKLFKDHPEWAIRGKDGSPVSVYNRNPNFVTMSMCSPYYDHVFEKLSQIIETCQLAYVKLDFSVATSAYIMDSNNSGDYAAQDSKYGYYKDQASSYWAIYQATIRFFDELSAKFPDLVIDCTFELWGRGGINDYALIQHADVDWLTNHVTPAPEGPFYIRNVFWRRSKVLPVQTMLAGNQPMDSPMYQLTYFSMASGTQIMCGDPRNLNSEQRDFYVARSSWFKEMDRKYQYSRYYFRSGIFAYAVPDKWDGVYRFNDEKGGGILFYFRNDCPEETRTFPVTVVDMQKKYRIYEPCGGRELGVYAGDELKEKGLTVNIPEKNGVKVLGIEEIKQK